MTKAFHSIITGDIRDVVSQLPTIHCVVTSPPYFDKMTYGDSEFEIGHEVSPDDYVAALCDIFSSLPLHEKGSIWVNIGDKRGTKGGLIGLPSMFSLEMRRRDFLLIDDVIWAKGVTNDDGSILGNFMTEPAPGRLNGNGWESLFRFTRSRYAWTDMQAVAVPRYNVMSHRYLPPHLMTVHTDIEGRRPTNVWQMPLGRTGRRHFSTMPVEIPERAIAMSCPSYINPNGTIPTRIVEMVNYDEGKGGKRIFGKYNLMDGDEDGELRDRSGRADTGCGYTPRKPVTMGWSQIMDGATQGIVLDPFVGVGTVGQVALRMGRSFIGVDLYDEFSDDARDNCEKVAEELRRLDDNFGWNPLGLMR